MKTEKFFVCNPLPTANCHASTNLPLDNDDVVFAWFGGSREGRKDVCIWSCVKTGEGFTSPVRIALRDNIPHWNPVLFRRQNGDIILFCKVGNSIDYWRTFYCISADGGRSFTPLKELVKGDRSGGRGPVKNKCLRLKSGRILAPASTEHHGWVCFTDISDDDGITWRKSKRVETEKAVPIYNSFNDFSSNKIPMIQPTLWQSDDGTVHMLTRTAAGLIYRSDSADEGETWCRAYPTNMPNNNSGIDIVNAGGNGLFLVSNPVKDNWGERSPLILSRSVDGGISFEKIMTLEKEHKGSEFSYPAINYYNNSLQISYTYERKNIAYVKVSL